MLRLVQGNDEKDYLKKEALTVEEKNYLITVV